MGRVRREVRMSADFERIAKDLFPPDGGSVEGRPSYEMFLEGPYRSIELAFWYWEKNAIPQLGLDAIRVADIYHAPFFPPMIAYGLLVGGEDEHVEVIGLDVNWEFYRLNEPDD